jgi:hypothetical protein
MSAQLSNFLESVLNETIPVPDLDEAFKKHVNKGLTEEQLSEPDNDALQQMMNNLTIAIMSTTRDYV